MALRECLHFVRPARNRGLPRERAEPPESGPGIRAFTLVEILVVVAILAILAAVLFPVFSRAKESAKKAACLSNLKQIGSAMELYLADYDDRLPDRRDLKLSLGYRPWTGWPPSDPRAGWGAVALSPYVRSGEIWSCPSLRGTDIGEAAQVRQDTLEGISRYWMWRFDRLDEPIPLDNFWGKTPEQCVTDLRAAQNPQAGVPEGATDVEMCVDPYFPRTIPSVPQALRGRSAHFGGRNRLFLDSHVKWMRDPRTQ